MSPLHRPSSRLRIRKCSLDDPGVQAAAKKALELIADGARVGLGSGRAASLFITSLGRRLQEGLRVTGVPTSRASAWGSRALSWSASRA